MRRAALTTVLVALIPVALGACGPVNAGSAFEQQFKPYLEDRDDLETFSISSSNTLPWSGTATIAIEVDPEASDREIVETVWEITHHEVEDHIYYDLQVSFESSTAAAPVATGAFWIGVDGAAPDSDEARDFIETRLDAAREIVELGEGEATMEATQFSTTLRSYADPLQVVTAVCDDDLLRTDERFEAASVDGAEGSASRVEIDPDDCGWIDEVAELRDAAAVVAAPVSYIVTFYGEDNPPDVTLFGVPPEYQADVAGSASELGIDVTFA